MKTRLCFWVLVACLSAGAADVKSYKLDREEPAHLSDQPPTLLTPTRADVRIAGPKIGFDETLSWFVLHGGPPTYSTTNHSVISNLVSVLGQTDNKERIPNESSLPGYTYHLQLFQDANKSVMHYRIFQPLDTNTVWCSVWPRSVTGFGYCNDQIGSWLHSRVNVRTNAPPASIKRQDSTNAEKSK